MDIFRYAPNAYGQDTLLGISWNLIFWFVAAAVIFSVLHAVYKLIRREPRRPVDLPANEAGKRVVRHTLTDRLYHWLLALAVIVLLVTAFGPHLGWHFHWLPLHWSTGIILCVLIAFHKVRAIFWQNLWDMLPIGADFRLLAHALRGHAGAAPRAGKYELLQKAYHWTIAGLLVLLVLTGAAMLVKVGTPLWQPNPYWLSDGTWGLIYTVHGLAALCVLAVLIVHVYFALRPGNFWMLRSMLLGWITQQDYLAHHDPQLWQAQAVAPPAPPAAQTGAAVSGMAKAPSTSP